MESRLKDSRPSSPFPSLDEEEEAAASEHLNEACLLSDSELSDDRGSSFEFSNLVVPETPERYRRGRSRITSFVTNSSETVDNISPVIIKVSKSIGAIHRAVLYGNRSVIPHCRVFPH